MCWKYKILHFSAFKKCGEKWFCIFPYRQEWILNIIILSFFFHFLIFLQHFISFHGIVYFSELSFQHRFWLKISQMLKKFFVFHSLQHFWLPWTEKCNFAFLRYFLLQKAFLFFISTSVFFKQTCASQQICKEKTAPVLRRQSFFAYCSKKSKSFKKAQNIKQNPTNKKRPPALLAEGGFFDLTEGNK